MYGHEVVIYFTNGRKMTMHDREHGEARNIAKWYADRSDTTAVEILYYDGTISRYKGQ